MKSGNLDDIENMVGRGSEALLRDRFMGHAGPMILEMSSLTWLNLLYATEIESLTLTIYDPLAVKRITQQVIDFNRSTVRRRPSDRLLIIYG